MAFVTKDVVTSEGVTKKQFYSIVGMEGEDGAMVNVRQWNGEWSEADIDIMIQNQKVILDELNVKKAFFTIA